MNSLVLALGSNLEDRVSFLKLAEKKLKKHFTHISSSQIYESEPVDYLEQDPFLNQVIEFELPDKTPWEVLELVKKIENEISGPKKIVKGPRKLDIDIVFFGDHKVQGQELTIPHPAWSQRCFVVEPLKELPCFNAVSSFHKVPETFTSWCKIFKN